MAPLRVIVSGTGTHLHGLPELETLLAQGLTFVRVHVRLAALIDASGFVSVDALHLPYTPQVVLELGEDAQHALCLARRSAGVDGLAP